MSVLALFGGSPAVSLPEPHVVWPRITSAHEQAVLALLRSGDVTYHRDTGKVLELEQRFAALVGVPWGVTAQTGTASILAGYFGLGLKPGDEVIVPAYTHLGTVFPMLHLGLRPVLCDVDRETANIDPEAIAAAIGPRTRAIAVTHQFGHSCDMPRIAALARTHDLRILEDCSHAHGSTLDGQHVGTHGDVACFSLHAHKTVWGGEGGILVSRHTEVAERAALHGHFRSQQPYHTEAMLPWVESGFGLKSRIHPFAAAMALVGLDELSETLSRRRAHHEHLSARMAEIPGLRLLPTAPGVDRGGFFRFAAHYDREALHGVTPQRFLAAVHAEGASNVWPGWAARTINSYRMFQTLENPLGLFERGDRTYTIDQFPNAREFSANTLQFPAFTWEAPNVIDAYADALAKVAKHAHELV